MEINECERYDPCDHGICVDRIADYDCQCDKEPVGALPDLQQEIWGGKNCSVKLQGCLDPNTCQNNGTCHPWVKDENNHGANCTCKEGFDGERCEHR